MKFTGLCTYPHGGYAFIGLWLASAGALVATAYGVSSCRLAVLTFWSDRGSIEDYFLEFDRTAGTGDAAQRYQVGIGLFQWLKALNPSSSADWTDGTCHGYQESMLLHISDNLFGAARGFGVVAILLGIVLSLWTFMFACVDFNLIQVILLSLSCLTGCICSGLAFLFFHSSLCQDDPDIFPLGKSGCELDEGGLVLIAAAIMWLISFCISIVFLQPAYDDSAEWTAAQNSNNRLSRQIAANRAVSGTTHKSSQVRESYSFDSQRSWTTPIPSRSQKKKPNKQLEDAPPFSLALGPVPKKKSGASRSLPPSGGRVTAQQSNQARSMPAPTRPPITTAPLAQGSALVATAGTTALAKQTASTPRPVSRDGSLVSSMASPTAAASTTKQNLDPIASMRGSVDGISSSSTMTSSKAVSRQTASTRSSTMKKRADGTIQTWPKKGNDSSNQRQREPRSYQSEPATIAPPHLRQARKESITVDDISEPETMEVYISDKLRRIQKQLREMDSSP